MAQVAENLLRTLDTLSSNHSTEKKNKTKIKPKNKNRPPTMDLTCTENPNQDKYESKHLTRLPYIESGMSPKGQ
jgi:hypothetical protein